MTVGLGLKAPQQPLFTLYTFQEIAERTGYSFSYMRNIMGGHTKPSRRFRANCAISFRRPESDLFTQEAPNA